MPSRTKQAGTALPLAEFDDSESQLIEGYRALVERIPGIVYAAALGEAGEWLYVSHQVESILGWSVEEWRADALMWYRQLHPDDRARALADEQRARTTGEPLNSEYRMIARDGRVIWFRDRASLVNDDAGNPAFLH